MCAFIAMLVLATVIVSITLSLVCVKLEKTSLELHNFTSEEAVRAVKKIRTFDQTKYIDHPWNSWNIAYTEDVWGVKWDKNKPVTTSALVAERRPEIKGIRGIVEHMR
jgi:hypothetical protein